MIIGPSAAAELVAMMKRVPDQAAAAGWSTRKAGVGRTARSTLSGVRPATSGLGVGVVNSVGITDVATLGLAAGVVSGDGVAFERLAQPASGMRATTIVMTATVRDLSNMDVTEWT